MDYIKKLLSENMCIGDYTNDEQQLHVELSDIEYFDGRKVLQLSYIFVPEQDRCKGSATNIVKICEEIAKEKGYNGMYVGPFVTEDSRYISKICKKRGYNNCDHWGHLIMF